MDGIMTNKAHIDAEILRLLYRQAPAILAASAGVGAVVMTILFYRSNIVPLCIWGSVLTAVTAVRFWWVRRARAAVDAGFQCVFYRRIFLLGTLVSGFTWGSLGLVSSLGTDPFVLLFITFVIGGMVAGCLGSLGVDKLAYASFAAPATLLTACAAFNAQSDMAMGCAVLVVVFCITQISYSRVVERNMRETIQLRFHNTDLIERLRLETQNAHIARESKQRFLSAAQHDMRQPAFALKLQQSYLSQAAARDRPLTNIEIADFAKKMGAPIEIISSLLEQLLELSRLEASPVTTRCEELALNDALASTCDLFQAHAQSLQLSLTNVTTSTRILADAAQLNRVLHNLVSNALRYTKTGGVVLGVHHTQCGLEIWIVDTGTGIAEADQEEIFREFTQLRKPGNPGPSTHGFGLGLAIVKQLTARLGFTVRVTSTLGKGSRFAICIPARLCARKCLGDARF